MLLYYITDRQQFRGSEAERRRALLDCIRMAVETGVDYVQLREKDLSARELLTLAQDARKAIPADGTTKLLINSRIDVAIAARADGVHLRSDDLSAGDARVIFHAAGITDPLIAVSCHSQEEVLLAESHGADFAVFGAIFGKGDAPALGIAELARVCKRVKMPVLALGGVTLENAKACMEAGAAGIAGVRIFQQSPAEIVRLRGSGSRL